jgi:hypothetical protein
MAGYPPCWRFQIGVGHHRMGGAEIDPDQIAGSQAVSDAGQQDSPRARRTRSSSARSPVRGRASSRSVPASVTGRATAPHHFARLATLGGQGGFDLLQLLHLVRHPEVEQGADAVWRRTDEPKKRKRTGSPTTRPNSCAAVRPRCLLPCRTAPCTAPRWAAPCPAPPAWRFHPDVVGLRGAAANAHAAPAPHIAVIGRAARHRQIEIGTFQQPRRRGAFGASQPLRVFQHALEPATGT